jgi:hypothetical protein
MTEQIELLKHHAHADVARSLAISRGESRCRRVKTKASGRRAHGSGIPVLQMVDAAKQRAFARPAGPAMRHDFATRTVRSRPSSTVCAP